jgi:serine/threonine protein phosphatase PrpC
MFGPFRVFPGRLSVSRTFGDVEAKRVKYGGNPKVVISIPEVKSFKIEDTYDFIILGCDGIFDKLSSQEVIKVAWEAAKKKFVSRDLQLHQICGNSVEIVLKHSAKQRTLDNITAVIVCFKNFKKHLRNELDQL